MKLYGKGIEKALVLAPMAGYTDLSFRALCREHGADITVSEMVSAKALCYGDKKSFALLESDGSDSPCVFQIFGSEPEIMARAAALVRERADCAAIDINMGCPVPKIFGGGDGSALMRDPALIFDIVSAVCRAVPETPVTVKLRSGVDSKHINAPECALAAQRGGAAAITVHGKTRDQMYTPPVDYEAIRLVKQAVSIPVIGNGDIKDGKTAAEMFEKTGCDAIMIGRAALGNPFVFEEVRACLRGEAYEPVTAEECIETARAHMRALIKAKGQRIGAKEARSHLALYLKGMRGAAALRARAVTVNTLEDIESLLDDVRR